ncbi:head decoration protein [Glutamicibacter sp. AOP3-A1-12]|uniref:head decoration protein n=1 Tax=Glutamicibacter sp. AOP3-A1-12 TaxID=3457701 RepID=UPI004033C6B7
MTSLNSRRWSAQSENRAWLRGPHGTEPGANANITLDIPTFAGLHPNGFIPSGFVVSRDAATQKFVPYDPAGLDGSEVPAGFLFGSLSVAEGATVVGGALFDHGYVNADRLPLSEGKGALDEAARTALTHIIFD